MGTDTQREAVGCRATHDGEDQVAQRLVQSCQVLAEVPGADVRGVRPSACNDADWSSGGNVVTELPVVYCVVVVMCVCDTPYKTVLHDVMYSQDVTRLPTADYRGPVRLGGCRTELHSEVHNTDCINIDCGYQPHAHRPFPPRNCIHGV